MSFENEQKINVTLSICNGGALPTVEVKVKHREDGKWTAQTRISRMTGTDITDSEFSPVWVGSNPGVVEEQVRQVINCDLYEKCKTQGCLLRQSKNWPTQEHH